MLLKIAVKAEYLMLCVVVVSGTTVAVNLTVFHGDDPVLRDAWVLGMFEDRIVENAIRYLERYAR